MLLAGFIASCSSTSRSIFSKRTPHEQYAEVLDDNDLDKTPEGRQWLAASTMALKDPASVQMPYRQHGFFASDKPRALGLRFTAKRGERLNFAVSKKTPFVLYADVYRETGMDPSLIFSADTGAAEFAIDIEEAGTYILRLQPELFRAGEYNLSVSVGPSLNFPVAGSKARTGSFWGDSREGGKRRHEGIDIFAPKRTPVIASADGVVTAVKEGGIGGKVVWLRLLEKNVTLYYAHLDKQLVTDGQMVKKGQTLGLVGNTGNAKHTPSHLHFGIYTSGGPIDPFPFVDKNIQTAPAVTSKNLTNYLRLTKTQKMQTETVQANTLLVPLAVNSKGYITELPNGKIMMASFAMVKVADIPVKKNEVAGTKRKQEERS